MKVYTSVTLDMKTGAVLDAESYDYDGPVAECKGGKGGSNAADQARADEEARQAKIREGTTKIDDIFGQNFNDATYDKRKTAFLDYANPQLENQYADAQKQLTFSLDRSGTLDSSARAQKEAELSRLYGQNRQAVGDQALNYETTARTGVEDARSDLIRTLNSTGDVQGAANSALSRAQALSAPDAYSPLGQLFSTFTAGLGQQAALERASAFTNGAIKPAFNTGLFGVSPNATKVTP